MSELIVQMEPPKLCFECFFRLDCELYMNEVMKPFGKRDFTAFKPLVNGCLIHGVLPEQHGDLIDRDKLKRAFCNHCDGDEPCTEPCIDIGLIETAPTIIDAVEVKHGEWTYNPNDAIEMMFTLPKCSVCGYESSDARNYCPNCGARMEV